MTHQRAESSRPRVLVLASTYPRWKGDPEPAFVHELARRLVQAFEVTVVCPHADGAAVEEVIDGVHVRRFRYAPRRLETLVNDGGIPANLRLHPWKWALVPGFALSLLVSLAYAAWRWRPDVVHAHWLLPQGLVAAFASALLPRFPPFVVTSHGADLFTLRGRFMRALKGFAVRNASAATVVSEAMAEELRKLATDRTEVSVRPMGVDLAGRFVPHPGVARSTTEILFVGRLVEKKGLRHLIDAMPAVAAACPDATLRVIGFGPEEGACRRRVEESGLRHRVEFLGAVQQEKLPDAYRRAAVLVAPFVEARSGDREGLGLVMVEAAGCGCPVIASDLPAVRDVADGTLVRTVTPGAPEALARAIVGVLSAPPDVEAVARGRAALRARFDWEHVAIGYAGLLRRASAID